MELISLRSRIKGTVFWDSLLKYKVFYLIPLMVLFFSNSLWGQLDTEIKIAFMADVHFADVYPNPETGKYVIANDTTTSLIRTMNAQLHSTRLFNENYFAFRAALEDAVSKGIKIIALPGDFSDDGQPMNIKGLNRLLDQYSKRYGLTFFLAPGNHDPTTPFGRKGGKKDFLGDNGKAQPIMSEAGMHESDSINENPTIILNEVKEWGYEEIVSELNEHGFFPKREYIYWETPFAPYDYESYTFKKAVRASGISKRGFAASYSEVNLPDVSYLVEPVNGLWLLALDANVHLLNDSGEFHGNGIGYNQVLKHKKHLISWTTKVVKEASRLGKVLIAFSHYPMLDFNDGASEEMIKLFGEGAFQARRNPDDLVGEIFADTGLRVHVGGHMHLNDTGSFKSSRGNTLINVQTPSLAAYPSAYKIITIHKSHVLEVKTILLDSIPGYNTFFESYEVEHEFLSSLPKENIWNKMLLSAQSYEEFVNGHLQDLVRLRLIPGDFPMEMLESLKLNGWELLVFSKIEEILTVKDFSDYLESNDFRKKYIKAKEQAEIALDNLGQKKADFVNWDGTELILDFYRLRLADKLALKTIPEERLMAYTILFDSLFENEDNKELILLKTFARIFQKQLNGEPAIDFMIDLQSGSVVPKVK